MAVGVVEAIWTVMAAGSTATFGGGGWLIRADTTPLIETTAFPAKQVFGDGAFLSGEGEVPSPARTSGGFS